MKQYKQTWTYHGIVEIPNFNGYIFNHGTESAQNERTANHKNDSHNAGLLYEVIYEKSDRLFGTDVISPSTDKEFAKRVRDELNNRYLLNSQEKVLLLKDWFNTLIIGKLNPVQRGHYDAIRMAKLSETECIFIPKQITRAQLQKVIDFVYKNWFLKNAKIRVSAKAYNDKTEDEKKMAAKPIPRALHTTILNMIRHGKKYVELLNYKIVRVQSLELAYLILTQREFQHLEKIKVILTADDKEVNKAVYSILKNNNKVEFLDCESDADVVEELCNNMEFKPDLDIMNPPYADELHLEILETVLSLKKPHATIVSIQPIRSWLEDPLAEYKPNSFDTSKIVSKISLLKLVLRNDANALFNINSRSNLGIILFNDTNYNVPEAVGKSIFTKLKKLPTLATKLKFNKEEYSIPVVTHILNDKDGRATDKLIVAANGPIAKRGYIDASDAQGWAWLTLASTSQEEEILKHYLTSTFIKNLVKLANSPRSIYNYLPIPKLDKKYTDAEYCEMFGLTAAEQEILFNKNKWYIVSPEEF